jgi:DNA-binding transcriptional MerR regulator
MTDRDAAYYDEVRKAVGRGAPTGLLGTSTKSLERSLAKLKAVQQAEEALPSAGRNRPTAKKKPTREARAEPARTALQHGDDPLDEDGGLGYRGPAASAVAGITYRQLHYWAATGLIEPTIRVAHEAGSQPLYSFRDILLLKLVKRLLDAGISLQQIRAAMQHLRDRSSEDLAQVTLMSDGESIYEATSPDEVVDLLAGGQGVFGFALGQLWQETAVELADVPAVRAEDGMIPGTDDQLAARPPRREANGEPTD